MVRLNYCSQVCDLVLQHVLILELEIRRWVDDFMQESPMEKYKTGD